MFKICILLLQNESGDYCTVRMAVALHAFSKEPRAGVTSQSACSQTRVAFWKHAEWKPQISVFVKNCFQRDSKGNLGSGSAGFRKGGLGTRMKSDLQNRVSQASLFLQGKKNQKSSGCGRSPEVIVYVEPSGTKERLYLALKPSMWFLMSLTQLLPGFCVQPKFWGTQVVAEGLITT